MPWVVHVDPSVLKACQRLPVRDAERLQEVVRLLPLDPYFGDIQKMRGEENAWRRRIGSYRLFYRVRASEAVILVFHLERRASKTYRHR